MNLNDFFHLITTRVTTSAPDRQGTAFYFHRFADPLDPQAGPQWRKISNTWLVTNRHLALREHEGEEILRTEFTFYLRRLNDQKLEWEPITLSQEEFKRRALFHTNSEVDIAVIEVGDLISSRMRDQTKKYLSHCSVSAEMFVGQNMIDIQASDDVLVVGYPHGYYDSVNLYPIIKSGIVASRWGAGFEGKRYFIIDAKLFPSSSGSIVVSKPLNIVIENGNIMHSKEKQFAFLGIFSAMLFLKNEETIAGQINSNDLDVNIGVVWYAQLIDEIIDKGAHHD